MSLNSGAGRPSKGQVKCNGCKASCSPKNGDWFFTANSTSQQIFLCRACERATDYKRTIPAR